MTGFDASEAALLHAGSQLAQVAGETRSGLGGLQSQADDLLGSQWTGGAARGFTTGWSEWHAAVQRALSALDEMADLLGVTGDGYGSADSASSRTVIASGQGLS